MFVMILLFSGHSSVHSWWLLLENQYCVALILMNSFLANGGGWRMLVNRPQHRHQYHLLHRHHYQPLRPQGQWLLAHGQPFRSSQCQSLPQSRYLPVRYRLIGGHH
jgi:hypothetical protein